VPPTILAVANQKGGVGKTTTAVSVGASLAEMGRKVLLIDIDPQANATSGLGIDRSHVETSIYDVVVLGRALSEARIPTMVPGLDIVPSDIALTGSEIFRQLVMERGWSPDRFEEWLAYSIRRLVIAEAAG